MDRINKSLRAALPLVLMTGLLVGQAPIAYAHDPGRGGDNRATSGCGGGCHSGATTTATVAFGTMGGAVPTSVAANSVNTLTFTVSGGPAVKAGLSVTASGGTLAVTGTESTIVTTGANAGELIHTAAAAMTGGSKVYTFTWTAPATAGTVTLTGAGVSSNGNNADTLDSAARITATITVTGGAAVPVVPLFTGPTTGTIGVPVTFDSSSSTGTIATRNWNFGDTANTTGVDATGTTATHSYATAGTFPVKLTVIDGAGVSTSKTQNIVISAVGTHVAPVANAGGPYMGSVGTAVAFNGSASTVSNGLTATYSWDFGDASTAGTGVRPSHTYTAAGTFTVKLTVTDNGTTPLSNAVTTTAVITAATTPPSGTVGHALYDSKCASCHGPAIRTATTTSKASGVVGASVEDIDEAIREVTDMQSLQSLPAADRSAIAAYLNSLGEPLYKANCESCHGPGGTGGKEPAVIGASEEKIKKAINTEPEMASLKFLLTQGDTIEAIAKFLKRKGSGLDDSGSSSTGAGALDWLSLIGVGAWSLSRRRKK